MISLYHCITVCHGTSLYATGHAAFSQAGCEKLKIISNPVATFWHEFGRDVSYTTRILCGKRFHFYFISGCIYIKNASNSLFNHSKSTRKCHRIRKSHWLSDYMSFWCRKSIFTTVLLR